MYVKKKKIPRIWGHKVKLTLRDEHQLSNDKPWLALVIGRSLG